MPGTDTITIYRGEDVELQFTLDPVENITGWTLEFTLRGASGILISKPGTVEDGPGGVLTVSLADTDTDSVRPGAYLYDVWRTDGGSERVLAIGTFKVEPVARETT